MNKFETCLNVLKLLVESAGESIEFISSLLPNECKGIKFKNDIEQLQRIQSVAIDGFFHCAAKNIIFTDISRIGKYYGRTLEDIYPGASFTFMQLAKTYWTFKVILNESTPDTSVCIYLLRSIDMAFAGVFFPTPGPFGQPKKLREKTMRYLIEQSGAGLNVEDYIRGNPYLR